VACEVRSPDFQTVPVFSGETMDLAVRFTDFGSPMDLSSAQSVVLHVVTNNMPAGYSYQVTGQVGRVQTSTNDATNGWASVRITADSALPAAAVQSWTLLITGPGGSLACGGGLFQLSGTAIGTARAAVPAALFDTAGAAQAVSNWAAHALQTISLTPGPPGTNGVPGHSPLVSMTGDQVTVDGSIVGPHLTGPQGLPGSGGGSSSGDASRLVQVDTNAWLTLDTGTATLWRVETSLLWSNVEVSTVFTNLLPDNPDGSTWQFVVMNTVGTIAGGANITNKQPVVYLGQDGSGLYFGPSDGTSGSAFWELVAWADGHVNLWVNVGSTEAYYPVQYGTCDSLFTNIDADGSSFSIAFFDTPGTSVVSTNTTTTQVAYYGIATNSYVFQLYPATGTQTVLKSAIFTDALTVGSIPGSLDTSFFPGVAPLSVGHLVVATNYFGWTPAGDVSAQCQLSVETKGLDSERQLAFGLADYDSEVIMLMQADAANTGNPAAPRIAFNSHGEHGSIGYRLIGFIDPLDPASCHGGAGNMCFGTTGFNNFDARYDVQIASVGSAGSLVIPAGSVVAGAGADDLSGAKLQIHGNAYVTDLLQTGGRLESIVVNPGATSSVGYVEENFFINDNSSHEIDLPQATGTGRILTIRNANVSSSHVVSLVATDPDSIEGATSISVPTNHVTRLIDVASGMWGNFSN